MDSKKVKRWARLLALGVCLGFGAVSAGPAEAVNVGCFKIRCLIFYCWCEHVYGPGYAACECPSSGNCYAVGDCDSQLRITR